jgi:hypothetical protein
VFPPVQACGFTPPSTRPLAPSGFLILLPRAQCASATSVLGQFRRYPGGHPMSVATPKASAKAPSRDVVTCQSRLTGRITLTLPSTSLMFFGSASRKSLNLRPPISRDFAGLIWRCSITDRTIATFCGTELLPWAYCCEVTTHAKKRGGPALARPERALMAALYCAASIQPRLPPRSCSAESDCGRGDCCPLWRKSHASSSPAQLY